VKYKIHLYLKISYIAIPLKPLHAQKQSSLQVFEDESSGESLQWDRTQFEEYACDHRV
jgi:hypothetical protein